MLAAPGGDWGAQVDEYVAAAQRSVFRAWHFWRWDVDREGASAALAEAELVTAVRLRANRRVAAAARGALGATLEDAAWVWADMCDAVAEDAAATRRARRATVIAAHDCPPPPALVGVVLAATVDEGSMAPEAAKKGFIRPLVDLMRSALPPGGELLIDGGIQCRTTLLGAHCLAAHFHVPPAAADVITGWLDPEGWLPLEGSWSARFAVRVDDRDTPATAALEPFLPAAGWEFDDPDAPSWMRLADRRWRQEQRRQREAGRRREPPQNKLEATPVRWPSPGCSRPRHAWSACMECEGGAGMQTDPRPAVVACRAAPKR
jgi:hypothetical protein